MYDYDYDYPTPEDDGYIHESDLPNFDSTRDYLQGIVEAVYKTGDLEMLEHCLEELCGQFELKYEMGELQLAKKKNGLMTWYLGYQRATLDMMNINHARN